MKIVSVVGARPQFVKAFPLSREIRKKHREWIVHTGQHYDWNMSGLMFDELGIPAPDVNLEVGSALHGKQTGMMLARLEDQLVKLEPDVVIVYGDTNSTLAGALAASKLGIKVAHVEAGMRCWDLAMPEEINRTGTDRLSSLLFCSTRGAVRNLKKEGITAGVHMVGDVMVDALRLVLPGAERKSTILDELKLKKDGYLLCTVHRAANTEEERLKKIVKALLEVKETVVFPVHPRTRKALRQYGLMRKLRLSRTVRVTEPVGYLESLVLQRNARLVLTDSGGIQKEAYILGTPCLTLRDETEWTETVESGWNVLVGTDCVRILHAIRDFQPSRRRLALFGDGNSSVKIASVLSKVRTGHDKGK